MAKSNRAPKARPTGKRSLPTQSPVQKQANQPVEPVHLPAEFTGLNAFNSVETQTARLNDPRLQTVQRQALARRIGRVQGNQQLQRAIVASRNNETNVQRRLFGPETRSEREIIEEAIRDQSGLDILSLNGNFQAATPQEKFKLIDIALTKAIAPVSDATVSQLWQSLKSDLSGLPQEEKLGMIAGILNADIRRYHFKTEMVYGFWESFSNSPQRMIELLSNPKYLKIWQKSADWADLDELPMVEDLTHKFEFDIKAVTLNYLSQNEAHIEQEMKRLELQDAAPTAESMAEMQATQKAATDVAEAQTAQQAFRQVPVGYQYNMNYRPGVSEAFQAGGQLLHHISAEFQSPTGDAVASGLLQGSDKYQLAYFNPEQKPQFTAHPNRREEEKFPAWEELKKSYDELSDVITSLSDRYPAIAAMLQTDGSMGDLAKADNMAARPMVAEALAEVRKNIHATRGKIGDDISVYDLEPIQAQLIKGLQSGPSGFKWDQPFFKWVAQDAKSRHESREFWRSLGLGALAAAAFVFSSLATGGAAAFLFAGGLAAGAAQAAISWERYLDLAQAAKTNVKSNLAIVSQGQVNAALLSAILDTAFALLDVYGPAKAGYRLLRGGSKVVGDMARAGAKAGSRFVDDLDIVLAGNSWLDNVAGRTAVSQVEKQAAIEQAITAVGVEETVRRSGKSVDQLLKLVDPDSAVGKRLTSYKAEAGFRYSSDELAQRVDKIKVGASFGNLEDDRIIRQLIEQKGPQQALREAGGWQNLAQILEPEAIASKQLYAWREQVFQEMEEFVFEKLQGDVVRAMPNGTLGQRLTIEFVGEDAVEISHKARSYLAGRLGVEPDQLEGLIHASITANPQVKAAPRAASGFFEDEVTDVSGRAAVKSADEVGETTKVMNQKQLDNLRSKSRDKNLDYTRQPSEAAEKTSKETIEQWRQKGVKHKLFMSAAELTELCQVIFKRPIEPFEHVFFHTDLDEFAKVVRRTNSKADPRKIGGLYEADTGFIHIGPRANEALTVLHEAVHRISTELNPSLLERLGSFLDEGITEWIARSRLGPRAARHGYDPNVQIVEMLAQRLGTKTVENVLIHGDFRRFWRALVALFNNDSKAAYGFKELLEKASSNGKLVDPATLGRARKILDDIGRAGDDALDNQATGQWRKAGDDIDNQATGQWRKAGDDIDSQATGQWKKPGSQTDGQNGRQAGGQTSKSDLTPPTDFPPPGTVLARGGNYDIVHSVYIDAARRGSPYEIEAGLYRRTRPDGSYEYVAIQGQKGAVSSPGHEWETVAHFHPGAAAEPGFRNPAPQDLAVTMNDFIRRGAAGDKEIVEMVHSEAADGSIVAVEFGLDPRRKDGSFFVRPPDSNQRIYFVSLYPDDIQAAVYRANAIVDPAERMRALISVFKQVDPKKYYAGWWANQFSPAMTAQKTP